MTPRSPTGGAPGRPASAVATGPVGHRRTDRGSGTVLVVAAVGVLLAATVGALAVVSAVVAGHRASAAADFAALASAAALLRGEPVTVACQTGATVAARNGASLTGCRAEPDLSVQLEVRVPASVAPVGEATATSRAGPAASGGPVG